MQKKEGRKERKGGRQGGREREGRDGGGREGRKGREGREGGGKEKVNWTLVLLPNYTSSPAQIFLVFCIIFQNDDNYISIFKVTVQIIFHFWKNKFKCIFYTRLVVTVVIKEKIYCTKICHCKEGKSESMLNTSTHKHICVYIKFMWWPFIF